MRTTRTSIARPISRRIAALQSTVLACVAGLLIAGCSPANHDQGGETMQQAQDGSASPFDLKVAADTGTTTEKALSPPDEREGGAEGIDLPLDAAEASGAVRYFFGEGFAATYQSARSFAWSSVLAQAFPAGYGSCRIVDEYRSYIGMWLVRLMAQCSNSQPTSESYGPTQMVSTLTGMCAAVGDNSNRENMHFIQYKCDGKANKYFTFTRVPGTTAWIIRVNSTQMCVIPRDYSTAEHTVLVQNRCSITNPASQWTAVSTLAGTYTFRNVASGQCLSVAWGRTNSGQPLDQATCGLPGQEWRLAQRQLP